MGDHSDRRSGRGRSIRIDEAPERRPLLQPRRSTFPHELDGEVFSCFTDEAHSHLPVYTNIHRIRRDITSVVEDYLSLDQLIDVRINVSVVRPLVDKLYEQDDISIVYCLLVNRVQFLEDQSHLHNRQNVNFSRATLCELIATRILRRFNEDNEGPEGLLVLAHILVAGFEPFQNAPPEIRREVADWHQTLPALEIAILSESKLFLSSTACQKVIDGIYEGRIIYTPSSFLDLIPDRYKLKPIALYDPKEAPLLNQYRLIVPRTRNILEILQFVILLGLYVAFMAERDPSVVSSLEICFTIYGFGWVLDQFATILEHGWHVYTQNLWSFLDVTFAAIYWVYLIMRIYGWRTGSIEPGRQAFDVLAMGAPVLIPRLAFNLLSDNLLFLSLRSMMSDFALLSALAGWCFFGFLLSLVWVGNGVFDAVTIAKWMIYIWFGLDGSGIQHSTEFHEILGPALMIAFAFLGNTLFLTILVSMLSSTFSTIVSTATAEIQFRHAVLTLEGVKSDAIFAYQPPFNILAVLVLAPLKFFISPRWFHKIHVFSVRLLNLPILLIIAFVERRVLRPEMMPGAVCPSGATATSKSRLWFWDRWRLTAHGDITAVFDLEPPDTVVDEIATDDTLTKHMIRRQYTRNNTMESSQQSTLMAGGPDEHGSVPNGPKAPERSKTPSRRDSIAPFPGLRAELRGMLSESDEVGDITSRLEALEESTQRIESMLAKLVSVLEENGSVEGDVSAGRTGTLGDLDRPTSFE
ncbi:hypothetical protein B0H66DRAFT_612716 [Apodospora peruviana]|uniref:Nonselective cation channel n=1 Tax=Apodospora peruviana TaxID=516989 RepID=A0AAE0ITE4_9PEZI|nr:hypothetical protein B0H66DRAFT_612716 [Apodospora peruviana]